MKNNKSWLLAAIISTIGLSGCSNKSPSIMSGDFGVNLNHPAGELVVTGYNDDYTFMTILPPSPSSLFEKYSVNVDKNTKNISKINAINIIQSGENCEAKKQKLFSNYKDKYSERYRDIGNIGNVKYITFDNSIIKFSCNTDLIVSYELI